MTVTKDKANRKKVKKIASDTNYPAETLFYRNLLNSNQFLTKIILVCVIAIISEALAIFYIAKISEPQVRYVEFTHSRDNFYTVHMRDDLRPESNMGMKLLRSALREYVYNRHRKDHVSDEIRGKKVLAMSLPNVIQKYKEQYISEIQSLADVEREIKIISDSILDEGIHQIEFETIDANGLDKVIQSWNASIKYEFNHSIVNVENELINPLNVYVSGYSISKRKKPKTIKEVK